MGRGTPKRRLGSYARVFFFAESMPDVQTVDVTVGDTPSGLLGIKGSFILPELSYSLTRICPRCQI